MGEEFKPYKHDNIIGDYYSHPTFGIISATRTQSSRSEPLFGSSILHSNSIRIEISHAELTRSLNEDRIYDKGVIVEVEMSPTQFADMITSLNIGCGTPCTLRWITKSQGEDLTKVDVPYQNKVQQFNNEFKQDMRDLTKGFDEVINLANETHAQKRLIKELELLKQRMAGHAPFVAQQFAEQMDKTVTEAKGEVEAFVTHAVHQYGLDAIRNQAPQLPEANSIDAEVKEITEGEKNN